MLEENHPESGMKLIHIATLESSFDMCDFLMSVGAEADSLNTDGKTCLHLAAESGEIPLFSLFLTSFP